VAKLNAGGKSTDFCRECSVLTNNEFLLCERARIGRATYTNPNKFEFAGVSVNLDLSVARRAAEDAATAAESVINDFLQRGNWSVTLKQDDSPVTEVDVATEQRIKQILTDAVPAAAFFGEETGKASGDDPSASQYRWLVDPIDGTKSFIRGMPFYSTQIALEDNGELIVGVSHAPAYKERLVAVRGEGVWLNDTEVKCSDVDSIDNAFLSSGNLSSMASHAGNWERYGHVVRRARRVRGYGDFCHYHQLCCGQTDLIVESDVNILDIAALTVAIRVAGGVITDLSGSAITEETTSVLAACTKTLHDEALAVFTFTLILWLVLVLLVFTGLGVFRLYFDFELIKSEEQTGQLFSLIIRGGQSFNIFSSEPFGRVFWFSQLALVALSFLMPMFRLIGGSLLALLTAVGISILHMKFNDPVPAIPLEFELLMVGVLFAVYVLLNYIGEVRDRKRVNQLLSQYIPEELAQEYRKDPQLFSLRGEERNISVLFCDVVGFSAISEQLEPQQLADWLNLFFTHVSRIVVRYRGSIDKYMGDSVMAVWGAPARSESHAYDALCAAMDIQSEIEILNKRCLEQKLPTLTMGIGISTGQAMVGPLGSEYRMDYTVVGDTVNVAQRLEEQTRKYQVSIIVSDGTVEALPDMLFRELDTVTIKGRKQQVTMFEPLGVKEQVNDIILNWLKLHQKAMKASKDGQWDLATDLFGQLKEDWGPAGMYELYLRGIEQARKL